MNATLDKNYIDLNGVLAEIFLHLELSRDRVYFNIKKQYAASMRSGRIRDPDVPAAIRSVNFWVAKNPH